jgi:hypothetical protein
MQCGPLPPSFKPPPPPPAGTYSTPCKDEGEADLGGNLIRGRRPQIGLEEDVETILGVSARLYEVRQLSWRLAQVDQRASS